MPNMSYIRFENTADDLEDCLDHLEEPVSKTEHSARKRLIQLAYQIVERDGADITDMGMGGEFMPIEDDEDE